MSGRSSCSRSTCSWRTAATRGPWPPACRTGLCSTCGTSEACAWTWTSGQELQEGRGKAGMKESGEGSGSRSSSSRKGAGMAKQQQQTQGVLAVKVGKAQKEALLTWTATEGWRGFGAWL